jgi:hypothetical protein
MISMMMIGTFKRKEKMNEDLQLTIAFTIVVAFVSCLVAAIMLQNQEPRLALARGEEERIARRNQQEETQRFPQGREMRMTAETAAAEVRMAEVRMAEQEEATRMQETQREAALGPLDEMGTSLGVRDLEIK